MQSSGQKNAIRFSFVDKFILNLAYRILHDKYKHEWKGSFSKELQAISQAKALVAKVIANSAL